MYPSVPELRQILLDEHYITTDDSKAAETTARNSIDYIERLISLEALTKPLLGHALAEHYNIPFVDLAINPPQKQIALQLPEEAARQYRVILIAQDGTSATLATDAPAGLDKLALAALLHKHDVALRYALPEQLDEQLLMYERPLQTRFSEIITTGSRVAPGLVNEIIKDALGYGASDIHFEPQTDGVLVRFRVDGNLHDAGRLPLEYYENVLNRLKVESGMRIDEHLAAQDGALQFTMNGRVVDMRVSLVPTVEGEKVAIRALGSYVQSFTLTDIGLSSSQQATLETYVSRPFGMVLAVGPTGSGKTTTLYSVVKMLNKPSVNITSIEDPVEYKVRGVNQIPVREQTGMTFARGLRSIVRQDPNIIFVGEIRDQETAEVSVNAALTGHLLLSTFHANDAASAIVRLIEMGIEPFLLASTLELVIAQRLVRKICMRCRSSVPVETVLRALPYRHPALIAPYFARSDTVYAGKGCTACNGTGYAGRTALFEFIGITPAMQDLIARSPSISDIAALARQHGESTMFEDGITKVKSGLTTIEEVLRVVEPAPKRT
ncbi:MAG TPA: GspE/PulE family protein [Candidatus Saccharimonadales bacterium]